MSKAKKKSRKPHKNSTPTQAEIETAIARSKAFHPNFDYAAKRNEAIAEGYKDEKCRKCDVVFLACHHFVRCDAKACPMRERGGKSVLEKILGEK